MCKGEKERNSYRSSFNVYCPLSLCLYGYRWVGRYVCPFIFSRNAFLFMLLCLGGLGRRLSYVSSIPEFSHDLNGFAVFTLCFPLPLLLQSVRCLCLKNSDQLRRLSTKTAFSRCSYPACVCVYVYIYTYICVCVDNFKNHCYYTPCNYILSSSIHTEWRSLTLSLAIHPSFPSLLAGLLGCILCPEMTDISQSLLVYLHWHVCVQISLR